MRSRTIWRRILAAAYLCIIIAMIASFSKSDYRSREYEAVMKQQMITSSMDEAAILLDKGPSDPVPTASPIEVITADDDLLARTEVTVQDMEYLIDVYTRHHEGSLFHGTAQAFIQASEETGYDPIFLFSLAGLESGWNVSYIHSYLCNPYSIGMIDTNIWNGMKFDTFEHGIISGAHVIYDTWYANGRHTLNQMQEVPKYATDELWGSKVSEIMTECYTIINSLKEVK